MRLAGRHQRRPRPDSHHNAKLIDADVELLLTLHGEEWGYRRLATGLRWVRAKA